MAILRYPSTPTKNEFERTFGVPLMRFYSAVDGFHLPEFDDEVIHSEDGESMEDKIEKVYGHDAVILIKTLLRFPIYT